MDSGFRYKRIVRTKKSANKKLSAKETKKEFEREKGKETLHSENLVVPPDEVDDCKKSDKTEDNSESWGRLFFFSFS